MSVNAIVCGGRDYTRADRVNLVLDRAVAKFGIDTIIEGGADGADRLAKEYGLSHDLSVIEIRADWHGLGKRAGPIRNMMMLAQKPQFVIAFPGSTGTAHMVAIAQKAKADGMDVEVFEIDK